MTNLKVINIATCLRCRKTEGQPLCAVGVACVCPVDGKGVEEHAAAGECPRGLLKAVPTQPTGAAWLAHGVAGVAKAMCGVDRADDAEIERRLALCAGCEHATTGLVGRCGLCGCAWKFKIRVKGEKCPAGKW